jgi:hypothetical protein
MDDCAGAAHLGGGVAPAFMTPGRMTYHLRRPRLASGGELMFDIVLTETRDPVV